MWKVEEGIGDAVAKEVTRGHGSGEQTTKFEKRAANLEMTNVARCNRSAGQELINCMPERENLAS